MPDGRVLAPETDPAELTVQRESIRLAFMAALQHLPPRQRVVLILREVLRWKADEVAALLGSTVASVNSALQRARATMDASGLTTSDVVEPSDEGQRELLSRYLDAFERYDLDALTALLAEDATLSMPPYPLWMRGQDNIRQWLLGCGLGCRDSRLLPTVANGSPAFGQYRPRADGGHAAWALQVIEIAGWPDRRPQLVPRHPGPVPALRVAAHARAGRGRGSRRRHSVAARAGLLRCRWRPAPRPLTRRAAPNATARAAGRSSRGRSAGNLRRRLPSARRRRRSRRSSTTRRCRVPGR